MNISSKAISFGRSYDLCATPFYQVVTLAAVIFFSLIFSSSAQTAQDWQNYYALLNQAMNSLNDAAQDACNPTTYHQSFDGQAGAQIAISGFLKKMADAGVNARGTYHEQKDVGALAPDFKGATLDPVKCEEDFRNIFAPRYMPPYPSPPPPPPLTHTIVIQSGDAFINNYGFGPVDGDLSDIILKIDGKIAFDYSDLSQPLGSHTITISDGTHNFEFVAKIYGSGPDGPILDDQCSGFIKIDHDGIVQPQITITQKDGTGGFSDCSLSYQ